MNSILAVERGLPPGLWLPLAEETTEQYLRENFDHQGHEYADIVDYGAFIVAMTLLGSRESGRTCMMPNTYDMNELYDAEHIPALQRLSGIGNVVRYKALQGNPGYLAIYEIERPEIPASRDWSITSDAGRWKLEVKPYLYNASFVVYETLREHGN